MLIVLTINHEINHFLYISYNYQYDENVIEVFFLSRTFLIKLSG